MRDNHINPTFRAHFAAPIGLSASPIIGEQYLNGRRSPASERRAEAFSFQETFSRRADAKLRFARLRRSTGSSKTFRTRRINYGSHAR